MVVGELETERRLDARELVVGQATVDRRYAQSGKACGGVASESRGNSVRHAQRSDMLI